MILGVCKIANALIRDEPFFSSHPPLRNLKPWLLYLAVPAYVLISAA